jgi:hypothetical protein
MRLVKVTKNPVRAKESKYSLRLKGDEGPRLLCSSPHKSNTYLQVKRYPYSEPHTTCALSFDCRENWGKCESYGDIAFLAPAVVER